MSRNGLLPPSHRGLEPAKANEVLPAKALLSRADTGETVFEPVIKMTDHNARAALPADTPCGIIDPQVMLDEWKLSLIMHCVIWKHAQCGNAVLFGFGAFLGSQLTWPLPG